MASASTPATSGQCPRICSGRTMFTCLRRPPVVASSIVSVIDSKPWYCLTIFFTVVLLLASDVRDLWFSQKAELAFNVILTCTLSFLLLDVILRSIADPDYFAISILGKAFRPTTEQVDHGFGTLLRIGSFLFWCDLVSTLFLIFDIEWFVSFRFVKQTIEIQIDELGSPVRCLLLSQTACVCFNKMIALLGRAQFLANFPFVFFSMMHQQIALITT